MLVVVGVGLAGIRGNNLVALFFPGSLFLVVTPSC